MENNAGSVFLTPRPFFLSETLCSLPGGGEAGSMEGLRGRETGQDEDPGPFPALPLLIYCIPFCGGESGESQEGLREGETRQYPPQYFTPRIQVSQNDWQSVCTAH
jgi:hypothetical protein